jgi:hypothetical protein
VTSDHSPRSAREACLSKRPILAVNEYGYESGFSYSFSLEFLTYPKVNEYANEYAGVLRLIGLIRIEYRILKSKVSAAPRAPSPHLSDTNLLRYRTDDTGNGKGSASASANPLLEGFLDCANEQNGGGTKKSRHGKENDQPPVTSIDVDDDRSYLETQSVSGITRGTFPATPTTTYPISINLLSPNQGSSVPSKNLLSPRF